MLSELTMQYGLYRMYRKYFISRIKSLSEESIGFGHKTDAGFVHIWVMIVCVILSLIYATKNRASKSSG